MSRLKIGYHALSVAARRASPRIQALNQARLEQKTCRQSFKDARSSWEKKKALNANPDVSLAGIPKPDLAISEDGFLIDTKTGKVINEMGATRFDVAVRALRGELDPPEWVENSERSSGILLSALYQFPRAYLFQVVGRTAAGSSSGGDSGSSSDSSSSSGGKEAFVSDVKALVARVTQAPVEEDKVEVKERMGGKYVSVAVDVVVRAPEIVGMVYDELAKDPRVIMKF